ncbi:hypothetical protein [Halolamina sp. C58]|uniref:hypothetical protein n=1 Tax=Halolamina sp. C58 TaxID=3421640 RepID=UPI003EBB7F96
MNATTTLQTVRPAVMLQPLAVWLVMAVVAVGNGVFRETVLIPRMDEYTAHVLSTAMLVLAILAVSAAYFGWSETAFTRAELLLIGAVWTLLTVGFEFLVGYAEGTPVSVTIGQYDVFAGQVWIAVPLTLLFAPLLFGWWLAN